MMTPELLKQLIDQAERGKPELTPEVLSIDGYSAPRVRRLLNALCSQSDTNYLEIGVHVGSTLIPALWGNQATATAIDNWSLVNGRRDLDKNLKRFLPKRKIQFIEADALTLDLSVIHEGVTVYFYDGDHSATAQYQAVMHIAPILAHQFVLVVDDANWEEPREETKRAIHDLGYRVLAEHLLPGAYNGDQAQWWNGLLVELVEK